MKPISSYAKMFRPASSEERRLIRESLISIGQQDPVELYHDEVIDGRTRQDILIELGKTVEYREIADELDSAAIHPAAYAAAKNAARRHLTATEVASSVAACLAACGDIPTREAVRQVAKAARVGMTVARKAVTESRPKSDKPEKRKPKPEPKVAEPKIAPPPAAAQPEPSSPPPVFVMPKVAGQRQKEARQAVQHASRTLGVLVRAVESAHQLDPNSDAYDELRRLMCQISNTLEGWRRSLE